MKTKQILLFAVVALAAMMQSCKKDAEVASTPKTSATELISLATTVAPTMDGTIDASWDACNKLSNKTTMPAADVFDGLYKFFEGEAYTFTLRSMYDATNIYFLVELDDLTKSVDQRAWYFDATAKLWKRPANVLSATEKFGEDKFGFAFPISSNVNWDKYTCYSTCHVDNNNIHDHYSDVAEFNADLWHWRSVQSQPTNQLQDGYITVKTPSTTAVGGFSSGRKSDVLTNTLASATNSQNLLPTGSTGTTKIAVPMYVLTDKTGKIVIDQADIDNKSAKLVTAVDLNGVLTLEGGTTLDPNAAAADYSITGSKKIFSVINRGAMAGSKGDVMTYAQYVTGKGWVIEVKRSLVTTDLVFDTQFDITKSYQFGFAVFDNGNGEHGVKPDLKLKFATVATF